MNGHLGTSNGAFILQCLTIGDKFLPLLGIGIDSGIRTQLNCLLQHLYYENIKTVVKSLVGCIPDAVEFDGEALEGRVSDGVCPNLIPQCMAGLLVEAVISLIAHLENESPNDNVSLLSQ